MSSTMAMFVSRGRLRSAIDAPGLWPHGRWPPCGLAWVEVEAISEAALMTPGLVGWNITIYNPDLDPTNDSAIRLITFLEAIFAQAS